MTRKLLLTALFLSEFFFINSVIAQIRIGPGSGDPLEVSTTLEVKSGPYPLGSPFRGLLFPTVTTTQRNQIQAPAKGLVVFNTTTNQVEFNTGTPSAPVWTAGGVSSPINSDFWRLTGNAGTTNNNFLGTTDLIGLNFRVNNQRAGWIDPIRYNVAFGYPTLNTGATGEANTALGAFTLPNQNSAASFNTAVGYRALFTNTTGAVNIALGGFALESNTSGDNNTALGHAALRQNTTGRFNTAVGTGSLAVNTTGYENVAMGANAAGKNITGYSNLALGTDAMAWNTAGFDNVAVGASALLRGTGYANTSVGTLSLLNTSTGFYNTALGDLAGQFNTTGYFNTFIGVNAGPTSGNGAIFNSISIGAESIVNASNTIVLGNSSITSLRSNVQTISSLSDKRVKENVRKNVPGLSFLTKINPVTYTINKEKEAVLLGYPSSKVKKDEVIHSGFIAQEVEAAAKSVGYDFEGVRNEEGGKYYTLGYTLFVVPLVQAVKELNSEIEQLKVELKEQKAKNSDLEAKINRINDLLLNEKNSSAQAKVK